MPPRYGGWVIRLKRAYEAPSDEDGFRILVDRLWPRGISKERAALDLWLKDAGPSTDLRKWYGHVPERWPEFQVRYRRELAGNPAFVELARVVDEHAVVTLVFGARDTERNEAAVLRAMLEERH